MAPVTRGSGAIVVAVGEGPSKAARPLARELYRDARLRPSVDEATARVLAGDRPPETAPARLKEISELCSAALTGGSEVVQRRLLASLGNELGVALVVVVSLDNGRPIGRVFRVAAASFEPVELGATAAIASGGERSFLWPGVAGTLAALLPSSEILGSNPALAPRAGVVAPLPTRGVPLPAPNPAPAPFWKSGWFWGGVGGVAAVALTIFAFSKATGSSDVHLQGTVGP
jgi:hypothetical protein